MIELRTDRPGIALLVVMLVTMVVGAIAAGAALIGANTFLINEFDRRSSLLGTVADAGLELGRARLNANPALYSDTATITLERDAAVYDADGAPIRGVTRTVYALPLAGGLGEYGNFAALVAVAEDGDGARVVRRLDLVRESFSSFAYFTDVEPDHIAFGNGDQLYGPVHSNDDVRIVSSGATFHGPVTTTGAIDGAEYATFLDDTATAVTHIPMPTVERLESLRHRATPAHLAFTAATGGNDGQATLRLEFVARDVDGDGVNEGFLRAYASNDVAWLTGTLQDSITATPNCVPATTSGPGNGPGNGNGNGPGNGNGNGPGSGNGNGPGNGNGSPPPFNQPPPGQCFLGGADELAGEGTGMPRTEFRATDSRGSWIPFPGPTHPALSGQPDADYLFPLERGMNPTFRGVIYVDGKVVVSGTVRSRLTVAASGNIIIGDDLVYDTDPGAGTCTDILGLFSGRQVVVADNTLNAPQPDPSTGIYATHDDTPDEFVHASILALDRFRVQNAGSGATTAEPCGGTAWGRGCLHLTGGLVQETRGIVSYGSGTGYVKRYTHDTCTFTAPPPYFPSTGHFWRGRTHEVDPTAFDIADYYEALN